MRSDFRFEDLKSKKMTVYLVLPADRLEPFKRWLRLLIQQALTVNARNIAIRPDKSVLFLLDEMPALGHLTMVEQAFGLMAGFGIQLWGICQDIPQLTRAYGASWESFVGNSGVLQYFGSRDYKTADYFSKLCGVTTVQKVSFAHAIGRALSWVTGHSSSYSSAGSTSSSSSSSSSSVNESWTYTEDLAQRQLIFPDELMILRDNRQLLIIENCNPINPDNGRKIVWHADQRFSDLGVNLHNTSENQGAKP